MGIILFSFERSEVKNSHWQFKIDSMIEVKHLHLLLDFATNQDWITFPDLSAGKLFL